MKKEKIFSSGTADVTGDFIFGSGICGTSTPIDSIDQDEASVIVTGYVANVAGRESEETNRIFFDVVDSTQGIPVQLSVNDKKEYMRILETLKAVNLICVQGDVRFDTYRDEFVLFATCAKEVPAPQREDTAETKRAELHAHTKMSGMDSVVSTAQLIKTAADWGWDAVAITDIASVQAFPDAMKTVLESNLAIKVIYGMEGILTSEDYKESYPSRVMILAKNQEGLRNLYQLVSLSHLQYFHHHPRIPKRVLEKHRGGLLLGAAGCADGELIRAIAERQSEDELLSIASFYDYLEIQPIGNLASLTQNDEYKDICADEDLRNINRKIAELAKKRRKLLVATGNVHFLRPEEAVLRAVLQSSEGVDNARRQPPLFLRTTEEMLAEFNYLGKDCAYEAVVENPRCISDTIGKLEPIPDTPCLPSFPNADDRIKDLSYQRARQWYGDTLPSIVQERLRWELESIIGHRFAAIYWAARTLVEKSKEAGYLVSSRGTIGGSFVAALLGITEVNPLPPHWRCPKCQYSAFVTDGSYASGFDLPDKKCPNCGTPLAKDGHDIPAAVCHGLDGSKKPDIGVNISPEYRPAAVNFLKQFFGDGHVFHAGVITTVKPSSAYGFAKKYFASIGKKKQYSFLERIAEGCAGAKISTDKHPFSFVIVPQNMDVHHFTPIQHPANAKDTDVPTTHFDYRALADCLLKLNINTHEALLLIKRMETLSRCPHNAIPFNAPATLSLFRSTDALGVSPEKLGTSAGTWGIPGFQTKFLSEMLDETQPTCFDDLVKVFALSFRPEFWFGNARDLIRNGVCALRDVMATQDDIMMYLVRKGFDARLAYRTMSSVISGHGIPSDAVETLEAGGVPKWYIASCRKIEYLIPRAHAVSYAMMAYRVAYYKANYPTAFYRAHFLLSNDTSIMDIIMSGKDAVFTNLKKLEAIERPDDKQEDSIRTLQLAFEMYLRGYTIAPIELNRSDAQ